MSIPIRDITESRTRSKEVRPTLQNITHAPLHGHLPHHRLPAQAKQKKARIVVQKREQEKDQLSTSTNVEKFDGSKAKKKEKANGPMAKGAQDGGNRPSCFGLVKRQVLVGFCRFLLLHTELTLLCPALGNQLLGLTFGRADLGRRLLHNDFRTVLRRRHQDREGLDVVDLVRIERNIIKASSDVRVPVLVEPHRPVRVLGKALCIDSGNGLVRVRIQNLEDAELLGDDAVEVKRQVCQVLGFPQLVAGRSGFNKHAFGKHLWRQVHEAYSQVIGIVDGHSQAAKGRYECELLLDLKLKGLRREHHLQLDLVEAQCDLPNLRRHQLDFLPI
eukprot:RCo052703